MTARYRIGIDIGGTFTDFVLFDEATQELRLHKRLTTPDDAAEGAIAGLGELLSSAGIGLGDVSEIVHGTTLVTNAVIERKGAAVGMLTTRGFRDVIEMGIEQRYDIYDLFLTFPQPLVERARRLEVAERVAADGGVVVALDDAAVRAQARALVEDGAEAIAVCLMHSYRNPAHELRIRDILREEFPDLFVSLSCEVVAQISEYPRFVTTTVNAYVQPLISRYLSRLDAALRQDGFAGRLRMMHSAAGLTSLDTARRFPVRLLESGPAGGALAARWFGEAAGIGSLIAFDMGGTTAKACLVEDGRIEIANEFEAARTRRFKSGSGLPISTAVVDMIEIGAGGGSIAAIDELGLLQVGPHSAGAAPGPASYGRGGSQPTVTDASVVLGYYDPGAFLGGRMQLDVAAAEAALRSVAEPLGLSAVQAAWGIHKIVAENMAAAAQIHLVEHGKDPKNYPLLAFGGAGPTFGARLARILGIGEVVVPPASGAASAFGFLAAPISFDLVRSYPVVLDERFDSAGLDAVAAELEAQGRALLESAGVPAASIAFEYSADMRLVGQLHEITVPLATGRLSPELLSDIRTVFGAVYQARYSQVPADARIEVLSFRVRAGGPPPALSDGQYRPLPGSLAPKGTRKAYFGDGFVDTAVFTRAGLPAGAEILGPAIIEEPEATTVLLPGDRLTVDAAGNLRIAVSRAAASRPPARETPADAVRRLRSDPVSLEITWSRLVNVAEEMWRTVRRTAFSLIMSESQDFGCAILDAKGETLAHSSRVMPVFSLTLPMAAKALLAAYPPETLAPGDVLITNDPWLCAGHLFDIAIVTPVFRGGRVVAVMGTVGHVGDIGGSRDGLHVSEVYEEGIQIPAMKIVRAGVENEDLFRLLRENIRSPDQVIGDIRSLITANGIGARRLLAFMDEYGMADLEPLAEVTRSLAERAMRDAIAALPDGVYRSEISNNPLGTPMRFPVAVTVRGEEIEIDFEGAPPQVARSGINSTLSYTTGHTLYPLKCMLSPRVRGNAGCYRPFTLKAPEGSILNCSKPAAVSIRTRTGWYLAPNLFRAFAEAAPDQVQAFSGLPSLLSAYGRRADGTVFHDHMVLGGGQGASSRQDGKSPLLWPTSAATASIELFEARSPVIVHEKGLLQDSGGAGRHRGGLGVRVRMGKRHADGLPVTVVLSPEGVDMPAAGLFGGRSGGTASAAVLDRAGRRDCGSGEVVVLSGPDEAVELVLSGGSGFGDPLDRASCHLEEDLRQGYVSAEAARTVYGRAGRQVELKPKPERATTI